MLTLRFHRWILPLALLGASWIQPAEASSRRGSRHPFVLVHGILAMGIGEAAADEVGPQGYFRGVPERLTAMGIPFIAPHLGMTTGIEERAVRLKRAIDDAFPTGRVNIVAHSIGGLAARHLITHLAMGNRVATLTMVGTPHHGTVVADWIVNNVGRGLGIEELLKKLGVTTAAFEDLTTARCATFNEHTPDDPRVRYFSLGGNQLWYRVKAPLQPFFWYIRLVSRGSSRLGGWEEDYLADQPWGPIVKQAAALAPAGLTLSGASDGVVPVEATAWGESFEEVDMDHLDQIGWGSSSPVTADFYERLVRDVVGRGY